MATLIGIAKTSKLLAEMEELTEAQIEIDSGLQGDARGTKRQRQISILFEDALPTASLIINILRV